MAATFLHHPSHHNIGNCTMIVTILHLHTIQAQQQLPAHDVLRVAAAAMACLVVIVASDSERDVMLMSHAASQVGGSGFGFWGLGFS